MTRIDRRKFLGASAAAASSIVGTANADQGTVAASRPQPLDDSPSARDPLGIGAQDPELTPAAVRAAIEEGIRFLKSQQLTDGSWPNQPHYDDGLTPLATLALVNAGCDRDDLHVAKALSYLRDYMPRSTYTASLQTMVFCAIAAEEHISLIIRNAKWLEGRQWLAGEQVGMWAMSPHGSTDHTDNSMTHFAMLALHEAERVGVHIRPQTWQLALDHWRKTQNDDASWGWGPKYPGTGSMTCAGIAAIVIANGRIGAGDAVIRGDNVVGCGLQQEDASLDRAFGWLTQNFSIRHNPGTEFWHSYYLYALERVGRMTAQRFIGDHDWYREGARLLVATQEFSGAWPADVEFQKVADRNVSTSFSLMFLAKGRWPVVMAHAKHEPADDWNHHRRALANLVSHVEQVWERNLTHQVMDLAQASVEDLLESPVLYLSGRNAPQLAADEKRKLRAYVDRGGFLFVERCCGGDGFDIGFRALIREVFPEAEHQLQPLPPDHPVWFADGAIDPEHLPVLLGIDVGCRTGVIYCPSDLSAYWELDRRGRGGDLSDAVRARFEAARQVGINELTYATGRDVAFKNPAFPQAAEKLDPSEPFERGKLYVANVLHPGGCHAAPAALGNLLRRAANDYRLEVSRTPHEVDLSNPELFKYHVLFMHGRNAFEFTPLERSQLREYLERGGTLLADAVCSSPAFTKSFRGELGQIFPEESLRQIPAGDPVFSPAYGGTDVSHVTRRRMRSLLAGAPATPMTIETSPHFEAITLQGRHAVVFSPFDISCALETEPMRCPGYVRRDAIQLALNLLLYALNQ